MGERSSDFRDTLLELIDTSPEPEGHPSRTSGSPIIAASFPDGEEARLQEHLARCRDCFDLEQAAAAFAHPDEEPNAGQAVESAALWRLLRPQLDPRNDPPPQNVRNISDGPRRPSRRFPLPMKLAASFFVALVGMIAWNQQLRSERNALRTPVANAPIFEIAAAERATDERELTMPAGTRMLVLHPSEEAPGLPADDPRRDDRRNIGAL